MFKASPRYGYIRSLRKLNLLRRVLGKTARKTAAYSMYVRAGRKKIIQWIVFRHRSTVLTTLVVQQIEFTERPIVLWRKVNKFLYFFLCACHGVRHDKIINLTPKDNNSPPAARTDGLIPVMKS